MALEDKTAEELRTAEHASRGAGCMEATYVPLRCVDEIYTALETAAARLKMNTDPTVQLAYDKKVSADKAHYSRGRAVDDTKTLQEKLIAIHLLAQALARYK